MLWWETAGREMDRDVESVKSNNNTSYNKVWHGDKVIGQMFMQLIQMFPKAENIIYTAFKTS